MTGIYASDRELSGEEGDGDLFRRSAYACNIATMIVESKIEDCYVIGLYSPWGYGKTSTLNMIEKSLGDDSIVIRFNPWGIERDSEVIRGLFTEISIKLEKCLVDPDYQSDRRGKWFSPLIRLWDVASNWFTRGKTLKLNESIAELLTKYGSGVGAFNSTAAHGVDTLAKLMGSVPNEVIKQRVEEKIQQAKRRVVIMVDDVDRLDKDEVFRLFKLIKVIADFKGVTYILAFDDIVVSKALSERYYASDDENKNSGREFIEKIVQIPIHLPLIEREALNTMLFTEIDKILVANKVDLIQEDINGFRSIFDDYIINQIKTPRMVKRYLNMLCFTLPLISKEVNIVDLMIIESLRLIYPDIYVKTRDNKPLLTGTFYSVWNEEDSIKKQTVAAINSMVGAHENVKEVIKQMFPEIKKAYEINPSFDDSLDDLRKQKRAASPDYFNRYFMYDIGSNDISDTMVLDILSKKEANALAKDLTKLLKNYDQSTVVSKLATLRNGVAVPIELAKSILMVSDELSKESKGMFTHSAMETSAELMFSVLDESDNKLRDYSTLVDNCSNLEQLSLIIRRVILGSNQEEKDPLLGKTDLDQFKTTALGKIISEASVRVLHSLDNHFSHFLYQYWEEFGGRKDVNKYLLSKLVNTEDILDFITVYLPSYSGSNGKHRGDFDRATYKYIEKVVDLDKLYKVVISEEPKIAMIDKYPSMERHGNSGVSKTGNERSSEFRGILVKQFAYLYQHKDNVST